ncbi:MAG: glycosyltransferase [Cytophagaceae bacterium]|nr:glycosyltransferase [Cytophagaceae bacterium]
MKRFSVIIPIYNRPEELDELLESLEKQTFKDFEVLVVEDGSTHKCDEVVKHYSSLLDIKYFFKKNEGQGFARNYAATHAEGEYLVIFDSDVVVPREYFEIVDEALTESNLDAYGGEDRADEYFNDHQKALSFAMTSIFTTGGIRSKKSNAGGSYQIRSYNMGIKAAVFKEIGGFKKTNMGEDMELNHRLQKGGYSKELIEGAYVYHKRRGDFGNFFKQILSFGRTRIQLKRDYNIPIKIVHTLPVLFTLFILSLPFQFFINKELFDLSLGILWLYFLIIFISASITQKSLNVGILSIPASFIQLFAYGFGFILEVFGKSNSNQT